MLDTLDLGQLPNIFTYYVLPVFVIGGYIFYYRKFAFYQLYDTYVERGFNSKLPRGKTPPAYPNGWYRLCRIEYNIASQVQEIKIAGRHITYYRGEDHKPYAVSSYCPHMGANLGHGGKVKYVKCIEYQEYSGNFRCPFHGWTFDGETGKCVNSEHMDSKQVATYEYCDVQKMTSNEKGQYIEKVSEGEIGIDRFHVREMNAFIYIWLHAYLKEPSYEPVRIPMQNMVLRGESINYVNCHIQEIPENGADIKHFDYVHTNVADPLFPYLQYRWDMKTCSPQEPDFLEQTLHPRAKVRAFQQKLYDVFLSDKDRAQYINVITLDCNLLFFNKWKLYAFTLIGFQTGPATVSLFVKGPFFEAIYQQSIQPLDKYSQRIYHTFFTNNFMPYWLSSYMLYGEYKQVTNDSLLWRSKVFSEKLRYNMKGVADNTLLKWRNWYSKFFQGAEQLEKELGRFEW